uniref:Hypotheticial protein n=1 Tax=Schistosoma japonicum TaxID=6182 RepID=C1L9I9_SCHJA|nr:hypotheticial protein [Schistosoma japonicum]CAX71367.1 hypotheticial protein [Schistosoma japonicum]CAX71371.1 hypotheticial protein [Schistosoma japonicum]CAX71372.1 hypotheticial protein [Schistosoma japonicum]CAX71374.1 hypotheticial protein [Schistosoma japonicum]
MMRTLSCNTFLFISLMIVIAVFTEYCTTGVDAIYGGWPWDVRRKRR